MESNDIVFAVRRMQEFIEKSLDTEIALNDLGQAAGYSPWYSSVIFKRVIGKPPFEYIRLLRLSKAAIRLRDENVKIIDVALDSEFNTHEGFTRAFSKQFGLTPSAYSLTLPPIGLFVPYRAEIKKGETIMEEKKTYAVPVFVRVADVPKRKLVLRRGIKATDYFEYCNESGCDVWGILLSIKEALNEPYGMWLPQNLRKKGTSEYCQWVEVPLDYNKPLPDGFEFAEFPRCKMMYFQGQPFKDEDYGDAIHNMWEAIKAYNPLVNGYEWSPNDAPRIQLEPKGERGYTEALPVREK